MRRRWQLFGYSAWVLFSALLVLIAGVGVVGATVHSSYDPHENRAPAGRIVIAALALVVAVAAAGVAIQRLRGTNGKLGLGGGLALTCATVLLLFLLGLVEIASGPL
jgi:hypothetical protein